MKNNKYLLFAALCATGAHAQATYVVHGSPRTCGSISTLDQAFSTHDKNYFSGWTDQDYDAAVAWATACANWGPPRWHGQVRISFLREQQQYSRDAEGRLAAQVTAAKMRAERAQAEEEARRQRERQQELQQEQEQKAEARRAQSARNLAHCRASAPYKLYEVQESIISDELIKLNAERALAHEKKIAEISGAVNLTAEHNAGSVIVSADERANQDFEVYKSLGGASGSPEQVAHALPNPCNASHANSSVD